MQVFNRLGQLVFQSNSSNSFWNGRYQLEEAAIGVYVVLVVYEWVDSNGALHKESDYQDVTLLR